MVAGVINNVKLVFDCFLFPLRFTLNLTFVLDNLHKAFFILNDFIVIKLLASELTICLNLHTLCHLQVAEP